MFILKRKLLSFSHVSHSLNKRDEKNKEVKEEQTGETLTTGLEPNKALPMVSHGRLLMVFLVQQHQN